MCAFCRVNTRIHDPHVTDTYISASTMRYNRRCCTSRTRARTCVCHARVCMCVCALHREQEGCVAHTPSRRQSLWPVNTLSAPATPDTLDCTRSPLPTSSHFTQPGLYSSKAKRYRHRCVRRPLLRTHTHAASASRRITSRLVRKVERPKPIIAVAGDPRPDARWVRNKNKISPQFSS